MNTIDLRDLRIETSDGTPIVSEIGFSIAPGRVMGLVGESGSGKSTIAKALLGYVAPGLRIARGQLTLGGRDLFATDARSTPAWRGSQVAYVPQDASTALNPALPIGQQMTERLVTGPGAITREAALKRVVGILEMVGLPANREFMGRFPSELSGGQLQRVGLTVGVAAHPQLLVLDEPTTAVDTVTRDEVLALVSQLNRDLNMSSLYVSHDLGVISSVADDVMVLYAGRIVEYRPKADFFAAPAHPYSRALLGAVPSVRHKRQLKGIAGQVPELRQRGSETCTFSSRCPLCIPACLEGEPPLAVDGSGLLRCIRAGETVPAQPEATTPAQRDEETRGGREALLRVSNLVAGYAQQPVIKGISFELRAGECTAVVGESGSGKSTLSRCLVGLHGAFDGDATFLGEPLPPLAGQRPERMHRSMQYVFQNPYASLHPRRSIGESLRVALDLLSDVSRGEMPAEVDRALRRVELSPEMACRFPNELSGGERQRVAIARALLSKPRLLICDEVTSALDVSVQASIVTLLRSLMSSDMAILFVTHDLGLVRNISDNVIVLNDGRIAEAGPTESVIDSPRDAYTRMLLDHALEVPAQSL